MKHQTVYLIRHGQVAGNILQLDRPIMVKDFNAMIDGVPHETINEEGINQIKAIAPQIASYNLTRLYASPLLRAQQSAQILAEATGLPVVTRDDIYELLPAKLHARPDQQYIMRGAYIRSGRRLLFPLIRDTETIAGAFFRMRRAWQEMTSETNGDFAIVGHQGIFRILFVWIRMTPYWRLVKGDTRNAGISIITRIR